MGARGRRSSDSDLATTRSDGSTPGDLWGIDNQLYDLRPIVAWHPGGEHILEATRGTDCTEVFFSSHPTLSCTALRTRLRPHWRAGGSGRSPYDWGDTALYDGLKRVVATHARTNGLKAADHAPAIAWYAAGWMITLWLLVHWIRGPLSLTSGLSLGLCLWLSVADTAHSGTHGAICRSFLRPGAHRNTLCAASALFCVHAAWVRQHILGHHPYTNTNRDPDVHHHPQGWIGWRVAPFTATSAAYRHWRLWLAPGMCLTQAQPSVANAAHMLYTGRYPGTNARVTWAPHEWLETAVHLLLLSAGILAHACAHGPGHTAMPFAVCGVLFYVFSQVSHVNAASFAGCAGRPSWARAQAEAARGDYCQGSYVWGLVSIGLNNQTLHHLFPTVHYCHYPRLYQLMLPVFAQHGIRPAAPQSFAQALRAHFAFLGEINGPRGRRADAVALARATKCRGSA